VGFILTVFGTLLLLVSLVAISFGGFMAMDPKNRDSGRFFAVWWVPVAAAASGVLMRDSVTFAVGLLCFVVAGAAFALRGETRRKPSVKRTRQNRDSSGQTKGEDKAVS
jgi:hypothetical protein